MKIGVLITILEQSVHGLSLIFLEHSV